MKVPHMGEEFHTRWLAHVLCAGRHVATHSELSASGLYLDLWANLLLSCGAWWFFSQSGWGKILKAVRLFNESKKSRRAESLKHNVNKREIIAMTAPSIEDKEQSEQYVFFIHRWRQTLRRDSRFLDWRQKNKKRTKLMTESILHFIKRCFWKQNRTGKRLKPRHKLWCCREINNQKTFRV